jgi:hypothetical protein
MNHSQCKPIVASLPRIQSLGFAALDPFLFTNDRDGLLRRIVVCAHVTARHQSIALVEAAVVRKTAALATSSGVPTRTQRHLATRLALSCSPTPSLWAKRSRPGVSIVPGLMVYWDFRSFKSRIQLRANDRTLA